MTISNSPDVIIATYGAKDATQQSITAALTHLPADSTIRIYDSPASDFDGTRDWLKSIADKVDLELGARNLKHWQALDHLTTKCTTEWVLALDSDLILTKAGVLEHMLRRITASINLAGELVPMYSVPGRKLLAPRIHAKLCLFRRSWFLENRLSWATYYVPLFNMYPWMHEQLAKTVGSVYFDTGAQLYHLAMATRSVREFRLSHCYTHLNAASVKFQRRYYSQIRQQMIEQRRTDRELKSA